MIDQVDKLTTLFLNRALKAELTKLNTLSSWCHVLWLGEERPEGSQLIDKRVGSRHIPAIWLGIVSLQQKQALLASRSTSTSEWGDYLHRLGLGLQAGNSPNLD